MFKYFVIGFLRVAVGLCILGGAALSVHHLVRGEYIHTVGALSLTVSVTPTVYILYKDATEKWTFTNSV